MQPAEDHRHRSRTARAITALALGVAALQGSRPEAHKAITSPYTYNEHVSPILRARCARCHVEGGPTPMSLTTYSDATPWAQSLREQLIWERMPPWYADPRGPMVKGGQGISPRELDILITWATGGTPEGPAEKRPAPVLPRPEWPAGQPDHLVTMPSGHTLGAGTIEELREFTLTTGLAEERWIKAADLLPGTPSMVREAVIRIDNGVVLAAWVPGHDAHAMTPPGGFGFRLPPAARIKLQIRYKKNWRDEQKALTDRSSVGLYFMDAPVLGKPIQAMAFGGPVAPESMEPRAFAGHLAAATRVLGVRPLLDQPYASLSVLAVQPGGKRTPLLRLRAPRQDWPQRYWLLDPVELPAGTKLEVTAVPMPPDPDEIPAARRDTLQVALDYVAL